MCVCGVRVGVGRGRAAKDCAPGCLMGRRVCGRHQAAVRPARGCARCRVEGFGCFRAGKAASTGRGKQGGARPAVRGLHVLLAAHQALEKQHMMLDIGSLSPPGRASEPREQATTTPLPSTCPTDIVSKQSPPCAVTVAALTDRRGSRALCAARRSCAGRLHPAAWLQRGCCCSD